LLSGYIENAVGSYVLTLIIDQNLILDQRNFRAKYCKVVQKTELKI